MRKETGDWRAIQCEWRGGGGRGGVHLNGGTGWPGVEPRRCKQLASAFHNCYFQVHTQKLGKKIPRL